MSKISNKCGLGNCEYYKPSNKSNCRMYTNREWCAKSMRKRSKIANHSKRRSEKESPKF